jgi:sugar phosphate isomerase/epimerase
MMELGIFAKTFEGSGPHQVFGAAARAGYSAVQYNMACSGLAAMPDQISDDQAGSIAAASKALGISIAAVSGTYNMIHPDKVVRDRGLMRLDVLASRCHAMGTRMITLCTGSRDPNDQWRFHPGNASAEAWHDLVESMTGALSIAERWDVVLGIEPELGNAVSSAQKARQLMDDLGSHRLQIVFDAANLFEATGAEEQRRIVSSAIDLLGDRIAVAHAKDRTADGEFISAGKGVLDYRHYLSCLKATGFAGPLITHGLAANEAEFTATFLRNAMAEVGVEPGR